MMKAILYSYWNIVIIATLILGMGWIYISAVPLDQDADAIRAPHKGFQAPEINLQGFDGRFASLSDMRGEVVLVNFWASWCPPCRAEMPTLQKVFDDYQEKGFNILAVNSTVQDSQSDAAKFASEGGYSFDIVLDYSGEVTSSYKIEALPTSFLVDRNGIILDVFIGGPLPEALLRERIEKLLR